ncbi:MAG: translation initiation factor IF-3 [Opitutaceae bacterium]|jgi:translation initiation factor IF-3|nr:translation initiation factor IF-3 [Opitutaceae bacterium]
MAISFPQGGGRRPGHYQRRNNDPFAHIRRNQRIRVPEIRVISPEGKQLGIMATERALALAQQFNLDLVEMAANATPPVCRIMDFGKYVYEESKKTSHVKSTASRIKEIEFTARIEKGDFLTKVRHAEEFLDHGNKVKLRLKFRGREMNRQAIGFEVMKHAIEELSGMGHPDSQPRLMGKQINVMLTPNPPGKRKRKYALAENEEAIDDTGRETPDADDADEPDDDSAAAPSPQTRG